MLSVALVSPAVRRALAAVASCVVLLAAIGPAVAVPLAGDAGISTGSPALDHLVVSELMTGGASASDEFVELHNPTAGPLPVEGLELVYVTATGATITRKATWPAGSAPIPPGGHLLIANDTGIFSAIADARYAGGLAAAGGSVALRVVGASSAIDAVGWGTAVSTWLETRAAPAPAAGSSLERLPGGAAGWGQDTNDNLLDFVVSAMPDPQNSTSLPISAGTPSPAPTASPNPTPENTPEATSPPSELPTDSPTASASPTAFTTPSPTPSSSSSTAPISIAAARALPDGAAAMVEGVALTDGAFTDGGGYLFDGTGGIAVLVTDGTFPRGELLRATGPLDDRYSQRTIRAAAAEVVAIGSGVEPSPDVALTGTLGEVLEGHLVQVSGNVASSLSALTGGIAFDLDDGSGPARVVVGATTGIDTAAWERGTQLTLVGVLGQRDSTGTGLAGYRLQPRDPADVISIEPPASPSPTPSPTPTRQPTATPTPTPVASATSTPVASATPAPAPSAELVTVAVARSMPTGAHLRIRGVVTLPSGLLDGATAVVQDPNAGILIRLSGTAGTLALGQLVELDGIRSTKSGMLSLRVSTPALRLGAQADPDPLRRVTGALGEAQEASLVVVRGAVATAILRSTAGTLSFSVDDGSGPTRITVAPKSGISLVGVTRGAWLEVRGVLGQETTGGEADKGYRIWPRRAADVTLLASVAAASSPKPSPHGASSGQLPALTGPDGNAGASLRASPGTIPLVALALPTPSPDAAAITGSAAPRADEHRPQAAALLGISAVMAIVAGVLGLRSRRRNGEDQATEDDDPSESPAAEGQEPFPHLSLLPTEVADAREERRILPPT